jgi:hypothetical protein
MRIPHRQVRDPFPGARPIHDDCWEGPAGRRSRRAGESRRTSFPMSILLGSSKPSIWRSGSSISSRSSRLRGSSSAGRDGTRRAAGDGPRGAARARRRVSAHPTASRGDPLVPGPTGARRSCRGPRGDRACGGSAQTRNARRGVIATRAAGTTNAGVNALGHHRGRWLEHRRPRSNVEADHRQVVRDRASALSRYPTAPSANSSSRAKRAIGRPSPRTVKVARRAASRLGVSGEPIPSGKTLGRAAQCSRR